jgi:Ca2+-binding EF-hand superfamily protein
VNPKKRCDG